MQDAATELRQNLDALDDAREKALAAFDKIRAIVRRTLDTCDGTTEEVRALVILYQTCENKLLHVRRHTGPTLQELAQKTILWK